ncbi:MAG: DUF3078 domain-containing protein [Bacteroides sp.]|nr:DUF3078 domain-containing protein [Bacteroides sp.]MCM1379088.1 DUF3078 domain-containing protein [Bacteroides sp.]MCM1445786.1 DUF3078 domain-containing protein [Prevotella sp.]
MKTKKLLITCLFSALSSSIFAQSEVEPEAPLSVCDSLLQAADTLGSRPVIIDKLPVDVFLTAVYTGYDPALPSNEELFSKSVGSDATPDWLDRAMRTRVFANRMMQTHAINAPWQVPYNIRTMAAPPKQYVATVDPITAATVFEEIGVTPSEVVAGTITDIAAPEEVRKQHWLNKFNVLLQFSQAFVSPNWYQGGNKSLNLLGDFKYESKLNTKFHPNLMFENYFQWRTVMTSTPDDPYRAYSLTENFLQINSKFGYKAIHNWYYSVQGMFKTPIFCGYKSGTQTRTASFMSPGELNLGVGMTYNYTSKNKKFNLSLSISPLAYDLKTVIDPKVDEVAQGLKEGTKALNAVGSNIEANWDWKICYNVSWHSRVFFFTDYKKYQYDWQNQFAFTINRWLSANLNVDLRYDTSMHETTQWKKFQLRELFSLGFSYTINH